MRALENSRGCVANESNAIARMCMADTGRAQIASRARDAYPREACGLLLGERRGAIRVPDFGLGQSTVSARSAAKGDLIHAGQSRAYLVYYRDPIVLGGCPSGSTFNATQTVRIDWNP